MRGLKKSCSSDEVCVEPDEDSQHQDIQLSGTLPVHLLVKVVLGPDVGGQLQQHQAGTERQEPPIPYHHWYCEEFSPADLLGFSSSV